MIPQIVQMLIPLDIWGDLYGILSAMMQPLYWAVSGVVVLAHWLFSRFMDPNSGWTWTLAIISLTVVIRSLMIPLFVRQINSSRKMQLVQPKLRALTEKYGHDRERLGQEQMKLYREEGINPMASCMPILVQMPIFLALFRVLDGAAVGTPRGQWLKDNPDLVHSLQNAEIFGAQISGRFWPITEFGAVQILALILIVLMTVVMFVTQLQLMSKNMPPEAMSGPMAQQQKMMLYLFPVIFAVGGVNIPIGVLIYWLTSNVWTMAQQYLLIHNNPAPGTPAFIDWEERMIRRGKDPDAILAKRAGKVKKKQRTTETSATGVVRQGRSTTSGTTPKHASGEARSDTSAAPKAGSKASGSGSKAVAAPTTDPNASGVQRVQRQQPTRQSRAKRKGGGQPRPGANRRTGTPEN